MSPTLAAIEFTFNGAVQIAILAAIIYYLYGIFQGTRSAQILLGAIVVPVVLYSVSLVFNFDVLLYIMKWLSTIFTLALVVVFQPEIRQAFSSIISRRSLLVRRKASSKVVDAIATTAESLSGTRTGALIAIERGTHLREWVEAATPLNAPVSAPLLCSVFYPGAPLHDGAVIIRGDTIMAARCVLPLSDQDLGRGTRHRAALGLSEKTDAVVVVVSEETGSISIAYDGKFITNLTKDTLSRYLERLTRPTGASAAIARILAGGDKTEAQP